MADFPGLAPTYDEHTPLAQQRERELAAQREAEADARMLARKAKDDG